MDFVWHPLVIVFLPGTIFSEKKRAVSVNIKEIGLKKSYIVWSSISQKNPTRIMCPQFPCKFQ